MCLRAQDAFHLLKITDTDKKLNETYRLCVSPVNVGSGVNKLQMLKG